MPTQYVILGNLLFYLIFAPSLIFSCNMFSSMQLFPNSLWILLCIPETQKDNLVFQGLVFVKQINFFMNNGFMNIRFFTLKTS